ncbi:MAG: hypothetical protein ACE5F1_03635 [Planctomycetota bacterium]
MSRHTLAIWILASTLPGQRALSSGPARFAVELDPSAELPASVTVYQGRRAFSRAEIVALEEGYRLRTGEFRGRVPKGSFRLGPLRAVGKEPLPELAEGLGVRGARLMHADGLRFPRYRLDGELGALEIRGDLYRFGPETHEWRLELRAGQDWDPELLHELEILGPVPSLVSGAGLRLARGKQETLLVLPPGLLRPGDACFCVLLSGARPDQHEDPGLRVWPSRRLLEALGLAPGSDRRLRASSRRLARMVDALVERRPLEPLDRGDFLRRSEPRPLWIHGEYDAAFGFLLHALDRRSGQLRRAAREADLHMLGRDLSRPWSEATPGHRLPVRHGFAHGKGAVDTGHVFLQGCLLDGLLSADRLLLESCSRLLDTLAERMDSPQCERLRDLAWPLLNFEFALGVLDRPLLAKASRAVVAELRSLWNVELGCFELPGMQRPGGRLVQDLWIVSGLLLPALQAARRRFCPGAKQLLGDVTAAIRELPELSGGYATHYWRSPGKGWRPSGSRADPCCAAWVLEGLNRTGGFGRIVRRLAPRVASELPGNGWDPATRLFLCLRLSWLRAGHGR